MKKITLCVLANIIVFSCTFAQSPESFKYQAVLRNTRGEPIQQKEIELRISIIQNAPDGQAIYAEIHNATTNFFGMVNLNIGMGESGDDFSAIDWASDSHFLKVEMSQGRNHIFNELGTSQLLSVPYALHAKTAENVYNNNDMDQDSTNELQILSIQNDTIFLSSGGFVKLPNDYNLLQNKPNLGDSAKWSQAYQWGNHQDSGYVQQQSQIMQLLSNVLKTGDDENSAIISNIRDPVEDDDVATKGYVDSLFNTINSSLDRDNDGFTIAQGDCDDLNPLINPDADEICDEFDNNCNGLINENLDRYIYYQDNDNDGYGDPDSFIDTCSSIPPDNYVDNNRDCDDTNYNIHPGAHELYNGIDDDCDGSIDEDYICDEDNYEPNNSCPSSFDLGSFTDTENDNRTINATPTNPDDVDWYRITTIDGTDFLSDSYNFELNISNPSRFVFDVYESNCMNLIRERITNFTKEGALFSDDSEIYYIKVYTTGIYQCSGITYSLDISNGN